MEDRISESEDRNFEMTLLEENKGKKNEKRKESRHNLWDSFQRTNIKIIWIPDVEQREKGTENLVEEIIAKNFPNLERELDIQFNKASR